MVTQRTYKFRFYPTPTQKRQLAIEFGHARYVWNWALEARTKTYQEQGERLNYSALSCRLTVLKKTECPWLNEATAGCHTQKLIGQDKAFKNFFDKRAKYPRFKKRHQTQLVRYRLDQRHVEKNFSAESKLLKLPKLGALKLKWSRPIESIPKRVMVSKDPCGRYFVSMACEVEIAFLPVRKNAIGVDVGVKDVAVTARIHARIKDSRRDFLHKTSSKVIRENQVICLVSCHT